MVTAGSGDDARDATTAEPARRATDRRASGAPRTDLRPLIVAAVVVRDQIQAASGLVPAAVRSGS